MGSSKTLWIFQSYRKFDRVWPICEKFAIEALKTVVGNICNSIRRGKQHASKFSGSAKVEDAPHFQR